LSARCAGHRLFRTPDRRLTIWAIWLALITIAPVAYVSELNIRDVRGEFGIYDDQFRKLTALYLLSYVTLLVPTSAFATWLCLRRHLHSVSLFAFDNRRRLLSGLATLLAAAFVVSIAISILKIDRDIWFAAPVEMAEIWYILLLRAVCVAPRDSL
jgi:hypothetical protein